MSEWSLKTLNISSDQMVNQNNQNEPMAFHGSSWRLASSEKVKEVKEVEVVKEESKKITEAMLKDYSKDQLVETAASLGVVNLDLSSRKLIELILEKSK